jgi:nitric oxide reductase NorD protein
VRRHAQPDGDELDLDAWVRHATEGGDTRSESPAVWQRRVRDERSLATLLLADLSLSTDAHVGGRGQATRVIEVIRDALYVFGEAMAAGNDPFEMLGFSSVRRQNVRIQHLKGFDEAWSGLARSRVGAVRPGYYTRMGAAIRHATVRLAARPERQRLLLLLTDGKPNDLDVYEGRYGLEDTRHALKEARSAGCTPFAVTIDRDAHDYLPMLFGQQGYALVHRPRDLPRRLAAVYSALTRG